jgi:hypothetical protein
MTMITRSEAFPSKYLKAGDLPEGGKVFKIAKLEIGKIGPNQEERYVLFFKGEKPTDGPKSHELGPHCYFLRC